MASEPVYEEFSRPLPALPPPYNPEEPMPKAAVRPRISNYGDLTVTEQGGVQHMGLSGRHGENARQNVTEASSYMAMSSPGRPRDRPYSTMNSTHEKALELRQAGGNGKKRQEREKMYVNV